MLRGKAEEKKVADKMRIIKSYGIISTRAQILVGVS